MSLAEPLAYRLTEAPAIPLTGRSVAGGSGTPSLPTDGLIGAWYASDYVSSPRPTIPNSVSAVAVSQNLLSCPRRKFASADFWNKQSATYTEGQADPDGGSQATRVNGTGDWYVFPMVAPVLPAGTYTLAVTARSHGGGSQSFKMQFLTAGLTSGTKTTSGTYQRFSFTGTVGAGSQTILFMRSFDESTAGDFDIIDIGLFAGASDPGEPALDGHCYLGLDAYSAPPCADGVLDLTSNGFGVIQWPDDLALSEFTLFSVANKTVDNTTFNAALSKQENYTAFGPLLDNSNEFFSEFGASLVTGAVPLANAAKFYNKGWKVCAHRYKDGVCSIFINGVQIVKATTAATTPASVREMYLGAFQAYNLTGGYEFNSVALWRSGLSDDDIATATAVLTSTANASGLSIDTTDRFYVAEGDSITVDANAYSRKYGANANPTIFGSTPAVAGNKITDLAARATYVDSLIQPATGRKFILSVLIGANDLTTGTTAGDFITALSAYCDARRAAGWTVVVCTLLPNTGVGFNTARGTVNTAIRTWVGTHADAICDFAAEATMGPDAAASNPTYYPDGIHPSDAGHVLLEAVIRPVLNAL